MIGATSLSSFTNAGKIKAVTMTVNRRFTCLPLTVSRPHEGNPRPAGLP
jgi:hypothetical protein